MKKNSIFTKNQKEAITAKGGTILISAAAGSGKTEVLSQRILEHISNPLNPININQLLIVTFTNAAAEQMKQRIHRKLRNMLKNDAKNLHLKRQQMLIPQTYIGTIHGFCHKIIRENFNLLPFLSQDFKIANTNEISLLKDEAIKEILEESYKEASEDFINLVKITNSNYSDSHLMNLVLKTYEFSNSFPCFENWFNNTEKKLYSAIENTGNNIWKKFIKNHICNTLNYLKHIANCILLLSKKNKNFPDLYLKLVYSDIEIFESLKNIILKNNWVEIQNFFKNIKFKRLPAYKYEIKQIIVEYRKKIKYIIEKSSIFMYKNENDFINDTKKTIEIIKPLFTLCRKFKNKLQELKIKKNLLDFSDLEHLTLSLLIEKNNSNSENLYKKTQLAKEISLDFNEILVDEYQDTNEIQNLIFQSISKKEENLFIVGDVKQSIYSFRQACPEIFINKKQISKNYNEENPIFPSKIALKKNFRSGANIIKFVNFTFSHLMTLKTSMIDYKKEEAIEISKKNSDTSSVEVNIIKTENLSEEEKIKIEAKHIANIIQKMILSEYEILDDNLRRKVEYKDFCILLRNTADSHVNIMIKAFKKASINVYFENSTNFFEKKEISMVISLLEIIDNPMQDISIVATLISPIFKFTLDEISEIRSFCKKESFYVAVKNIAFKNKKCRYFLEKIKNIKNFSKTLEISKFIIYIYDEFSLFSLMRYEDDSENKIANLKFFISISKELEEKGHNSISSFLRFIKKIKKNNNFCKPYSKNIKNAVKITSIHRAKGLEFPICILANCSFKFYNETDDTLLHSTLGIGINLFNMENMTKHETIHKNLISIKNREAQIAEELRVFYVALTRAKEKLILTFTNNNILSTLEKLSVDSSKELHPLTIKNANSFSDWILLIALRHPFGSILREMTGITNIFEENKDNIKLTIINDKIIEKIFKDNCRNLKENIGKNIEEKLNYEELREKFLKRFNFKYKYKNCLNIPEKISVSKICKTNLDISDFFLKPKFLSRKNVTSLEIGNIHHKFLNFANFKKAKKNLKEHIFYLVKHGILTKEESQILNEEKLKKFFESKLCNRIISSNCVLKEYDFTVDIKTEEIQTEVFSKIKNKKIIVEGVIDCVFEENNKITVVDYKTDNIQNLSKNLMDSYLKQLKLYVLASEKCFGKKVNDAILYFLSTNNEINLFQLTT
ncbi:MAG: helicase-exonuclease AddAB subunit AddA [Oscillospiraceae bacterium]|jgi:ATP-dependent helicase/nuclease subunit A|nr:helicase-exonuclease AddAB subunit AddA [Oscillospiraceae bacterium]